jgi:uncharacterized membrane protein
MSRIESTELKISKFLSFSVLICGAFIFCGWILNFKMTGNPFFNFEIYDRIPLKDLLIFHFDKKDWAQLISYLGLFLLISVPFIRVLMMMFLYLKTKEFILAFISTTVFIGLSLGLALGIQL